jgi:nitrogen fixation protein NifX
MKVAFATQDLVTVDAHFGWCPNLIVYEVTPDGAQPVARHAFAAAREDGDEDKLAPRVEAIAACAILYAAAIGGSAAARVVALGVHPVQVREGERIAELLAKLCDVLAGTPPPWLRKAMLRDGAARTFDPEETDR